MVHCLINFSVGALGKSHFCSVQHVVRYYASRSSVKTSAIVVAGCQMDNHCNMNVTKVVFISKIKFSLKNDVILVVNLPSISRLLYMMKSGYADVVALYVAIYCQVLFCTCFDIFKFIWLKAHLI